MAQELEDLLIKVSAECGDLNGIDSAISALSSLANFSQNAQKGAGALKAMADALVQIDSFGKTSSGIKKAEENIDKLINVLDKLSKYTGKARESIAQLSLLGKALQNFAGLGTSLKGLDKVADGINGIIDAMQKLAEVGKNIKGISDSMNDLGKAMDFSKNSKGAKSSANAYIQQLKKIREASKQKITPSSMDVSDQIKADTAKNVKALDESAKKMEESMKKATSFKVDKAKTSAEMKRLGDLIDAELEKYAFVEKKKSVGLDLTDAIENDTKKTISVLNRNMMRIKKLRESAEEIPFSAPKAPKGIKSKMQQASEKSGLSNLTVGLDDGIKEATGDTVKFASAMKDVAINANKVANSVKSFNAIADTITKLANSENMSRTRNERGAFLNFDNDFVSKIVQGTQNQIPAKILNPLLESVKNQVNTHIHTHPSNYGAFSPTDISYFLSDFFKNGIEKNLVVGFKEVTSFDLSKAINIDNIRKASEDFQNNVYKDIYNAFTTSINQFNLQTKTKNTFEEGMKKALVSQIEISFGEYNYNQDFSNVVTQAVENFLNKMDKNALFNANMFSEQLSKSILSSISTSLKGTYKSYSLQSDISDLVFSVISKTFRNTYGDEAYDKKIADSAKESLRNALTKVGEDANEIMKSFSVKEYTGFLKQGIIPEDFMGSNKELDTLIKDKRNLLKQLGDLNQQIEKVGNDLDTGWSARLGTQDQDQALYKDLTAKKAELDNKLKEVSSMINDVRSQADFIPEQVQKSGKAFIKGEPIVPKVDERQIKELEDRLKSLYALREKVLGDSSVINPKGAVEGIDALIDKVNSFLSTTTSASEGLHSLADGFDDISNKAPKFKNFKFNMGQDQKGDGFDYFRDMIKLLNEFREAIEKFEGIGEKLSGLQDALTSVNSLLEILKKMAEYTGDASTGIAQLKALGEALQAFSDLGTHLEGLDGIYKGVNKMIEVLKLLSEYKGKAGQSISQFANLGNALQHFADLGEHLGGLDAIYKGVAKMVEILEKLSGIDADAQKSINQLGKLGRVLHEFNGLDDNLKNLNDISIGLMNLSKSTSAFSGSQKSDFDYIKNIANALKSFDGILTGRQYANVAQITKALADLISVLSSGKSIDVNSIGQLSSAIIGAFNNAEFTKSTGKITGLLNSLSKAFGVIATQSGSVRDTMSVLVSGFSRATDSLYTIRENIEAIALDFTDALKPVTNSALFETLEKFKTLNDSYKNVGGLGQGLGQLLTSLDAIKGKEVNVKPLIDLLTKLQTVATDFNIEQLSAKFTALGDVAQPVGYLLNALKYSDLSNKDTVLTPLADQLTKFYEKIEALKGFKDLSWTLNAIKSLVEIAKGSTDFDAENNPISALGKSFEGFKGLNNLRDVEAILKTIKDIIPWLVTLNGMGDAINIDPILKIGEALIALDGIGKGIEVFQQFARSIKVVSGLRVDNLKGVDIVLEGIFETFEKVPANIGDSFKGLASSIRALDKLQDVEPEKLNQIADALTKVLTALGGIQGSNNNISIKLDSSGIANFQEVAKDSSNAFELFEQNIDDALKDIDYSDIFDLSAPLKSLRRQLYEAERMLHTTLKNIHAQTEKINRTRMRPDTPEKETLLVNQIAKLEQLKVKADDLRRNIEGLNEAIAIAPKFETDKEGYEYIHNLKAEYKSLEETMKRFKNGEAFKADSREGQGFQLIRDRMEEIENEIAKAETDLYGVDGILQTMGNTIEGLTYKTKEFADEMNRVADEAEKATKEMQSAIGKGFGDFGSMLSSSKSGLISSVGKVSSMFGKAVDSGALKLSEGTLASLTKVAGALSKVAFAISAVVAVIGVAVSAFMLWWNTMNKIREAIGQFLQKLKEFTKEMLTKVVGAFQFVANAVGKVVSTIKSGAEMIVNAIRKIGEVGKSIISIFQKVGNAFAPAIKGIKSLLMAVSPKFVKTLISSDFQLSKIIKQTHVLKNVIKTITRYFSMLTRMLMRKSITAFLNGMKQAFEDMVLFEKKSDDAMMQLNYNVSIVFSAMRRLANQVLAIFEPIINAVATPIETFLTGLQGMAENVAKFMAILTGQPYYLRAKKIYIDYGKTLEDTTKKAKNLTNALDELNILNDTKESSSDIDVMTEWEKVMVDNANFGLPALKDIIDKIVNFLQNIDWEKLWEKIEAFIDRIFEYINYVLSRLDLAEWLGKTIGDLINTLFVVLERIADNFDPVALAEWLSTLIINALEQIDWDRISRVVEKWASKLAQLLNEFFANDALWDSIVKTITNALREVFHYFETFALTFDFVGFADQLTRSLKNLFDNFPFEELRGAVEAWVSGLVDFINETMSKKEFWISLGQFIGNLINSIIVQALQSLTDLDFVQLSDSIKTAISNALDTIESEDFVTSVETLIDNIIAGINDFLGDEAFWTRVFNAFATLTNLLISGINKALTGINAEDISYALTTAFENGLSNVDWEGLFKIPANAINFLSNALRGLLDALPDDFNLGTWLTEHLELTLDAINWEDLEKNVTEFAQKISEWISGVLQNQEFWAKAGKATGTVIRIGLNFIFDLFSNVTGEDIGNAIANFVNNLVAEANIGNFISKTVDIALKFLVALDVAIKGIDWGAIGDQIAQGIVDAINRIYANRGLIRQTIEDTFNAISTFINRLLVKMINNRSFYKIGQIIGEVGLGIITGISEFFDMNLDEILKAMKDLMDGLAGFIHDHHDEIVEKLNNIIHSLVEIMDTFFDEKSALWKEINAIIEKLNLGELIGSFIRNAMIKLLALLKKNDAIWNALKDSADMLIAEVKEGIKKWLKYIWDKIVDFITSPAKIWEYLKFIMGGGIPNLGGYLIKKILGLLFGTDDEGKKKETSFNLSDLFGKFKFTGLSDLWQKIQDAWNKAKETVKGWAKGLGDFFDGIFGKGNKKEVEIPVEATTKDDEKLKLEDLVDKDKAIELEFEDASLGKIHAKTIIVDVFEPKTINTEEIYANVLYVTDIIADKLKVKQIETENDVKEKKMDELFGDNTPNVLGGTLTNPAYDKITAKILEITEKVTAPLLEIAEKITTPILEAWEKITTPLLEVAEKITTPLLEAFTITATLLTVPTINATTLNADVINSNLLNVGSIVASTLKVGDIEGDITGNISGVSGGSYIGGSDIGGYIGGIDLSGLIGDIEKPIFEAGERWSDISGVIESAEDYLDDFSMEITVDGKKITPTYLADNTTGVAGGTLFSGDRLTSSSDITRLSDFDKKVSDTLAGAKIKDLPDEAEYIRDYLMSFIGNEAGVYGLMGNLYAESKLRSNNLQDIGNEGVAQRDIDYTNKANQNGSSFIKDNQGYGLAQWTTSDRKKAFYDSLNGRSVDDLNAQLEYLKSELMSPQYSKVLETLRNASSIEEASDATLYNFEKPKDKSEAVAGLRLAYGQDIAGQLGSYDGELPEEIEKTDTTKKNFDELRIDDDSKSSTGSTGFLGNIVPYTEYTMAEVYNTIDKWLGRIWKLFKSFEVPKFLEGLADLDDIESGIDYEIFKEIARQLEKLNEQIEDINKNLELLNEYLMDINEQLDEIITLLEKLIRDGIKCHCDCECTKNLDKVIKQAIIDSGLCDDTHLINNTNAKSKNTKAVEENTKAIMDLVHNGLGTINCNCNCNCNCDCGSCAVGKGGTGGTGGTGGGGTVGKEEKTVKNPTVLADNELVIDDGTSDTPYVTPSNIKDTTPSGGTGKGSAPRTGDTDTRPTGSSTGLSKKQVGSGVAGDYMKLVHNGKTYPLYATLDGKRYLVSDDLPDDIKNRILNGEGTYDLDGIPLSQFKDKNASSKGFWLDKIRNWWDKDKNGTVDSDHSSSGGSSTPNNYSGNTGGVSGGTVSNGTGGSSGGTSGGTGGSSDGGYVQGTRGKQSNTGSGSGGSSGGNTLGKKGSYADDGLKKKGATGKNCGGHGLEDGKVIKDIVDWDGQKVVIYDDGSWDYQQDLVSGHNDGGQLFNSKANQYTFYDGLNMHRLYAIIDGEKYLVSDDMADELKQKILNGEAELCWDGDIPFGQLENDVMTQQKAIDWLKGGSLTDAEGDAIPSNSSFLDSLNGNTSGSGSGTGGVSGGTISKDDKSNGSGTGSGTDKNNTSSGEVKPVAPDTSNAKDNSSSGTGEKTDTKEGEVKPYAPDTSSQKDEKESVGNKEKESDKTFVQDNAKLVEDYKNKGKELLDKIKNSSLSSDDQKNNAQTLYDALNKATALGDAGNKYDKLKAIADAVESAENSQKLKEYKTNAKSLYSDVADSILATDEDKKRAKELSDSISKATDVNKAKTYYDELSKLQNSTKMTDNMKKALNMLKSSNYEGAYFGSDSVTKIGKNSSVSLLQKYYNEGVQKAKDIASSGKYPYSLSLTDENGNWVNFYGSDVPKMYDYWYKNSFLTKGYQMGGTPNSGEIFVARENGTPEFVGSFGNKTAVANNDQIVTAVANGVSMANDRVVSAIENQTNSIENAIDRKDLDVQIGDRQIAEANRRGEQGLGQSFIR